MADIRHKLVIKAAPGNVYEAVTTQHGLEGWWCKQTIAKPEVGSVHTFIFGDSKTEMKVSELTSNKRVQWQCITSVDEWVHTNISFELEEKDGRTVLRFAHSGWRAATDFFDACNYDWGRFLVSLKTFCETGAGTPS
jgi:uncharacterized protein YndB with AHSA1/START domain